MQHASNTRKKLHEEKSIRFDEEDLEMQDILLKTARCNLRSSSIEMNAIQEESPSFDLKSELN